MDVIIRDYKREDLSEVAAIVADAFRKDWSRVVTLPDDEMAAFLIEVGEVNPRPFEGYIVAENDGEIVGMMALRWAGQNVPRADYRLSSVLRHGPCAAAKLAAIRYFFAEKPRSGTCHVAELAVKASARMKGVGTQLLDYGKEVARKKGLPRYTLHVDADNAPALKLYQKTGFRLLEKKHNLLAWWIFGMKAWYLMSLDIPA